MSPPITSGDEAEKFDGELKAPCHDCPFRRDAIPGWVGSASSPREFVMLAHGETRVDCHAFDGPQCAGAAIYRSNVAKRPRDKALLLLPRDREKVFGSPDEFVAHHESRPKTRKKREDVG